MFVSRNLQVLERTGENGRSVGNGRLLRGGGSVVGTVGKELAGILFCIVLIVRSQTMFCTNTPHVLISVNDCVAEKAAGLFFTLDA